MFHPKPKYSIEELLAVYWKLTTVSGDADRAERKTSNSDGKVHSETESATCSGSCGTSGDSSCCDR